MPEAWATAEVVGTLSPEYTSAALHPGGKSVALDSTGDLVLLGGADGTAGVHSISQNKQLHALEGIKGRVTDSIWWDTRAVISSSSGHVMAFEGASQMANIRSHAGSATAIALHPSGEILGSVGEDGSFIFYDLSSFKPVMQIPGDRSKCSVSSTRRSYGHTDRRSLLTLAIRLHDRSFPPGRPSLCRGYVERTDQDL